MASLYNATIYSSKVFGKYGMRKYRLVSGVEERKRKQVMEQT